MAINAKKEDIVKIENHCNKKIRMRYLKSMTNNWSFAKITEILLKKIRSVVVSQNHYLNKIVNVHPVSYFYSWGLIKILSRPNNTSI